MKQISEDGNWEWDGQQWQPRQGQPQSPPQPPSPPRKRRRRWPWIVGGIVALFVLIGIIGSLSSPPQKPVASNQPTATPTAQPSAAAAAATPKPVAPKAAPAPKAPATVSFSVSGAADNGVDVTYGSDSDNRQGGNTLPWSASLPVDNGAKYYSVSAQLQGGGDITCSVTVNGVTKKGHASGSYNICQAEVVNFGVGWQAA